MYTSSTKIGKVSLDLLLSRETYHSGSLFNGPTGNFLQACCERRGYFEAPSSGQTGPAAAVAFAGVGLDKTRLRIISDSSIATHVISIKAKGDFGEYFFEENVAPSDENEKTGKIVSLALIKTLKNLTSNFIVGN